MPDNKIRIQKYLSQKNICSRREAETYIKNGWVTLNGEVVKELGTKCDPKKDKVELDKTVVQSKQKHHIYLAYNKPRGIVTNCEKSHEKSIKTLLPSRYKHLNAIGRLDKDSEGLILLTDDGVFAKKVLQSEPPHKRIYRVSTLNPLSQDEIKTLQRGVEILGKKTKPCRIIQVAKNTYKFSMVQGLNRQIRRMVELCDNRVRKLKRVQIGSLKLDLNAREYRELSIHEKNSFLKNR